MAPNNRYKRSLPRIISPPFPTASSTMIFETAHDGEHRWSGDSGASLPDNGYSALFTSGFLQSHMTHAASPSQDYPTPEIIRGPFHPSPDKTSPNKHLSVPSPSPTKTPLRRRRSSILHSTPSTASPRVIKSVGPDNGVERALDNVMRSLKVMAMGTPSRDSPVKEQSRWSMSSEESGMTEESGFWRSRKSEESTRSRMTVGTMRSNRSKKSKKGRKSEDTDRMDLDLDEDVPPVPAPLVAPATPGRRKRMMEGLAKKLGLTPKKKHPAPEPTEVPTTPRLPRKSSFSTLRSAITKKTSTGTLRSVRSTKSSSHPFMGAGPEFDCEAYPPPLPPWRDGDIGEGCMPLTPRRRTPKTSIGQPRLQPSTSPTSFLKDQPRRAPGTPKDTPDAPLVPPIPMALEEARPVLRGVTSAVSLREKLRRAEQRTRQDRSREDTPELSLSPMAMAAFGYGTPGNTSAITSSTADNTPQSVLDTPNKDDTDHDSEIITFTHTPPLTHRAAQDALKPKRLLNLLPQASRAGLGMQTPPSVALRSKKSGNLRPALGDVTNRSGGNNIHAILAKADQSEVKTWQYQHPFASRFASTTPSASLSPALGASRRNPRDPLGILYSRQDPVRVSAELPYRSGGGDGWDTPALAPAPINESRNLFDETFGGAQAGAGMGDFAPKAMARVRPPVPDFTDFTASPDVSYTFDSSAYGIGEAIGQGEEGVVREGRGRSGSVAGSVAGSDASDASMESDLPDEWELEAYLKTLERVDREREGREQGGMVGVGR